MSSGSRSEFAAPPDLAALQSSWRDDPLRFHHHLASFFSRGGRVLSLGAGNPLLPGSSTVVIEPPGHAAGTATPAGSVVRGRLSELPFSEGVFELAVLVQELPLDDDLDAVLAELARVVDSEGIALLRVPTARIAPGEGACWERLHAQVLPHLPTVQILAEESPGRVAFLPDAELSDDLHQEAEAPPALIVAASRSARPDLSWEGMALARLEALDGLVAEFEDELRDRGQRLRRIEAQRRELTTSGAEDRSDLELTRARCARLEERSRALAPRVAELEAELRTRRETQRELADRLASERSRRTVLLADLARVERRLERERLGTAAQRRRQEARQRETEELERRTFDLGHRLVAAESARTALEERIARLERHRFDAPGDLLDHAVVTGGLATQLGARVVQRVAGAAGRAALATGIVTLLLPLLAASLLAILLVELAVALQVKTRARVRKAVPTPLEAQAFSVVIPLGRAAGLDRERLAANCATLARDDLDNEVIVVLDEVDPELRRWLGARQPEVVVLDPGIELDFAEACNLGARRARRPHLLFIGSEIRLEDTALRQLRPHFAHAAVFGAACRSADAREHSDSREPETGLTWGAPRGGRLILGHSTPPVDVSAPVLWAPGRAAAFRRDRFLALGGFQGELYARDPFTSLDLSYRAWQRGWSVVLAPRARVRIEEAASSATDPTRITAEELTFTLRNVSSPALLLGSATASVAAAARQALAAPRGQRHGGTGAVLSALRHLGPCLRDRLHDGSERARSDREVFELVASPLRWRGREAPLPARPGEAELSIVAVAEGSLLPARNRQAAHLLDLLQQLARAHRVSVVLLVEGPEEVASQRDLEDRFARVVCVPRQPTRDASEDTLLPRELRECPRRALRRAAELVALEQAACVLHLEPEFMAAFTANSIDIANVLRQRELWPLALARRASAGRDRFDRLRLRVEEARVLWFTLGTTPRLDAILTALPHERSLLGGWKPGLPPGRIVPAPCGVPLGEATPLERRERRRILFAGDLRTPLGCDAARHLARDVVIPMAERDLHLELLGPGAPPELTILERDPRVGISALGPEDAGPVFARAGVFGFASRLAAGIQIEMLDALAAGLPVVTTPEGAEGLPLIPREHALFARTPGEFRAAIRSLWTDDDLWRHLATSGRRLVEEHYSCETAARDLAVHYQRVLSEKEAHR